MTETHVTNGSGTAESVTTVTPPKRDRAQYMRRYRMLQKLNGQINPEPGNSQPNIEPQSEINPNIPPAPEINADTPNIAPEINNIAAANNPAAPEQKPEAEHSKPDDATVALQKRIEELRQSEQLLRQHQEQQNRQQQEQQVYLQQINQVFAFWKQAGLSADQEQILIANPTLMIELSSFAAGEAAKHHKASTAEYVEAGKKLFFENLTRLQEQVSQGAAPQAAEPPTPDTSEPTMPNDFFKPPPVTNGNWTAGGQQQQPERRVPVSAPVSREVPSAIPPSERYEENPSRVVLTAEEKLLAKHSGVSEIDWARGKLEVQRRRRAGLLQEG
jgi:hypothetical protein